MLKHYVLSERKFGNKNEKIICVRPSYNTLSVDSSCDIGHFTLQYDAKHAMK